MTPEEFNRWPLLLSRKQVRLALGVNDRSVTALVLSGRLHRAQVLGGRRGKYWKSDVSRLSGVDMAKVVE